MSQHKPVPMLWAVPLLRGPRGHPTTTCCSLHAVAAQAGKCSALHLQHFVEALQGSCVGAQARDLLYCIGERAQLVSAPRPRRIQQLRQLHDAASAGARLGHRLDGNCRAVHYLLQQTAGHCKMLSKSRC